MGAFEGGAGAAPQAGVGIPFVEVVDVDDKPHTIPYRGKPHVVVYEDKDAGSQNRRAHVLLDKLSSFPQNHGRYEVIAVADVEQYDFWPAKKYVLEHLRKEMVDEKSIIFCDWKGKARKTWGLAKKKSVILVLDEEGKLRFAAQGPMSDEQYKAFGDALVALGLSVAR